MKPQYPITEFQELSSFTNPILFIPQTLLFVCFAKAFKIKSQKSDYYPHIYFSINIKNQVRKES